MKIMLDSEAQKAFTVIVDAALKAGGVQILPTVNALMQAAHGIPVETEKEANDGQ